MSDAECVAFLQWALPKLNMRWAGYRKVRRQVCKRIRRRMEELGIRELSTYRERLETVPEEWRALDRLCHITISRFFRDQVVFRTIANQLLPQAARNAEREERAVRCWSAACASGEEPYTIKILWDLEVADSFPDVSLGISATDLDDMMLERARVGCYAQSSLHELPREMVRLAFDRVGELFCVRPQHREGITFELQDLRSQWPPGSFDIVLCRNLAFTYFSTTLQRQVLPRILEHLHPDGFLILGKHEHLPDSRPDLVPISGGQQIFQFQARKRAHAVQAN